VTITAALTMVRR